MASTDLVPLEQYVALDPSRGGLEILREHLSGNEINEFDLGRVKVPAGGATSWEVPTLGGSDSRKSVDGVVVFFKNSRSFWEKPYEGGNEPPDCSSNNAEHAVKANDEVEIPASRDEEGFYLCDTCAYSEWGSSKAGGRGQACKLTRQLFILTPEKLLPLVVSLPPTSLRPASSYFLSLADHMIDYKAVVTQILLEKVSGDGVPDYSRALFKVGPQLSPEDQEKVAAYAAALQPHFNRVRVADREEAGAAA